MTPETQLLMERIQTLEDRFNKIDKPDRLELWKDIRIRDKHRILGGIYGGSVNSGGTAEFLPTGWTVSKTATGNYLVTHNLGTTRYSVVAVSYATSGINVTINMLTRDANSCKFDTILAGSDTDKAFLFILMLI